MVVPRRINTTKCCGCPAVHWHIDFLVACPPCRTCCFAPNICSSLPWRLRFTRACRESANQNMTAGQSAFGAVTFSWAARAKRRRHTPRSAAKLLAYCRCGSGSFASFVQRRRSLRRAEPHLRGAPARYAHRQRPPPSGGGRTLEAITLRGSSRSDEIRVGHLPLVHLLN
jgi:hypothetical protein